MYLFLLPLIFGFACNLASAFTMTYSRRWGERSSRWITAILRNVLGIPVWAIGYGLAARAPASALFSSNWAANLAGWLLIAIGGGIILAALFSLRAKAAAPSVQDELIQTGLYAHVRNPIHSGTMLEFAGLVLLNPTLPMVIACALGVAWVLLQTRFDELDLLQRIPAYRDYMRRVPRFIPTRKV
jgi:protein-S-isoprenylcysteine O-methyltransferase Ste14